MTVKRVILIRPGETDWNRAGRWQGWVAAPLNENGRNQAAALARYIRHIGIGALYTSPLRRAVDTAAMLAEPLGFAPLPDNRLRERKIGSWQGLTTDEIASWFPEDYARLVADPDGYRIPDGESRLDVSARMIAAFHDFVGQDQGETIAILSHSTAIRLVLAELINGFKPSDLDASNTGVTTIHRESDDAPWTIAASNDLTHLEGIESRPFAELEQHL